MAVLAPALLLIGTLLGAAVWVASTSTGLRAAAALVQAIVPGLTISGLDGVLLHGIQAKSLELHTATWTVRIDDLAIAPRAWNWSAREIDLAHVEARRAQIDWASNESGGVPASIGPPFALVIDDGQLGELALGKRGAPPLVVRNIALAGRLDPARFDLSRIQGDFGRTQMEGKGSLGARAPFAATLQLRFRTSVQGRSIEADMTADGSLRDLQVRLSADDSSARARVDAALDVFARIPLERLHAEVENFDPSNWIDNVPTMRLRVRADLGPEGSGGPLSVAGPFSVDNSLAGPIDRNRVPVRSVRGSLAWNQDVLVLDIEQAEGSRGQARGRFRWSATDGSQAQVRFENLDASTIHSRAMATLVAGQVDYAFRQGEQSLRGSARNTRGPLLTADVDLRLRQRVLELVKARLGLGSGHAEIRGRLELDRAQAVQLQGSFTDLDLGQLVKGFETRLNGTVNVDSRLRAPIAGRARFALGDSRVAGRPVTGRGTVELHEQLFDADVELKSGDAHLTAVGGLGGNRKLQVEIVAPDIAPLLRGASGRIESSTTWSGELDALRVTGRISASDLRTSGGHHVTSLIAQFDGGRAPEEPLAVLLTVGGHTSPGGPDSSIAGATLVARGTTASASIELTGVTASLQPLRLVARGGVVDGAWNGWVDGAEVGPPLDFLLREPTPLTVSPSSLAFGPAEFMLRGARFHAFHLTRNGASWQTSGTFEGLQPQALDAQARAPRRTVRTGAGDRIPLTLAGRWSLEYSGAISGVAVVERSGGDIYSGIDGLDPIGVSDVGAALNVIDNRVTGNVYMRGRALGKIDAEVDAYLDPSQRRLAQDRPLRVVVDADLPDLGWIGPLIGDNVQFGGQATVNAVIGGTPAEPTSTGSIRGDALRLAWVEQAVRLENGTLEAVLDDGVLVIKELRFAGTPRIAPTDLRALEGLDSGQPFEVRGVGRFALRSLTGSIGLKATQLPVLQRADRWMVVSGDAGITLQPERADLYAKLTVDGAYIDFGGARGARSLPNDVVVTKPGTQRKAAAAPVTVMLDVQGELGRRFYITGAGLNARLAGAVNLTGRPAQLRAQGNVRTVDGVFNGYGQRLKIQRGIVTFQGPVDNPALNVLALRTGLPVEVGVAVSGTAQRPLVRLHSDPSMSDTEKLNWLVLGRPPGASDGNDRALLTAAASALFAGQADSTSTRLMRTLGIDQITLQPGQSSASLLPRETVAGRLRSGGVTTSNSTAADFLAVGKRINDDLFLSFEQALTGAEYFVALNYRLSRQFSIIARAGSTNAIDLVYSIAFD